MTPRAVPPLCIIACPLNNHLHQREMAEEPMEERLADLDEPSRIVLVDEGVRYSALTCARYRAMFNEKD